MMGATITGSKIMTSKQNAPVSQAPSSALKIQSTKLGSQATEVPSASAAIGSKSLAQNGQAQQAHVEASFAAVLEPEVPQTRAGESATSIAEQK